MDIHSDLSRPYKRYSGVNQLEDLFVNGSPLPDSTQTRIVELAHNGMLPSDISRCLHVSNHCISEILARYYEIGSIKSCIVEADITEKVAQYKRETPSIFAWEIRDRLLEENICNSENIPSVSSINRVLENFESKSIDIETSSNTYSTISGDSNSEHKHQIYDTNHEYHQDLGVITKLTQKQSDALEQAFNCTHYPDIDAREKLAQKIHLHEARIQVEISSCS
ncbi:unnamed protein product [Rotaria sp. Silwood1]|nr:unnamed protein product [Rotaria sp. Silwood1]